MVLVRIGAGALVVLPFGVAALRGRWDLLWRNLPMVVMYGLIAVAGAQFCYFSACSTSMSARRCSSSSPLPPQSWSGCGSVTANAPAG